MEIIRGPLDSPPANSFKVEMLVERATLSKRRWRASSSNGRDFGFDLELPLRNGDAFYQEGDNVYFIAQVSEELLQVALSDPEQAARLGWMVGNLHLPIEIAGATAFTTDDPAARNLFARENVPFISIRRVFTPLSGAHAHH